jgi:D-threo-aldose 1-dehydrogenase
MKSIVLGSTELTPSVLGFGCSGLMARVAREPSVRVMEAAFDSGVTHFDVARSYGYGEAESAVGDFLRGKRDRVTVATKFGIAPPPNGGALRALKSVARRMAALHPGIRERLRRKAQTMIVAGKFDVESARRSFETSLRELRTDYVDLLLLHECHPSDLRPPLLELLERWRDEGKLRYWGIATTPDATRVILLEESPFAPVFQVADSVLDRTLESLPERPGTGTITHSAVASPLRRLRPLIIGTPGRAREWSEAVGIDCSDSSALGGLLLAYALSANPRGPVLYSSLSESNIHRNARIGRGAEYTPEQVARFAAKARESLDAASATG